ncbi:MAG: hypothetical protein EBT03_09425 [Betaproteobacteria bacterium]|nr:hypothetical protein [Betaproteobacteria bacterium]NCA17248.1 hypothetical protein [Betaproteobacteria bacterium]
MENILIPGNRVAYKHPLLGTLKGLLIEGGMHDDPVMFVPDKVHHPRLVELGYEPEAGFFTTSDGASEADISLL